MNHLREQSLKRTEREIRIHIFALVAKALVVVVCFTGWTINIVKLFGCDFEEPYKAEAIRIVGVVVPPVGAVTGFLDLGE